MVYLRLNTRFSIIPEPAVEYVKTKAVPIVVKADGLALGKGVIIANTHDEAIAAIHDIMDDKMFGNAGNKVVIERFITGQEVSVLAFTNGKTLVPMVSAQDHKRVYDNDKGPDTRRNGRVSAQQNLRRKDRKILL